MKKKDIDKSENIVIDEAAKDSAVMFENVYFSYDPKAEGYTLENVSFKVKPGSYVALIGHNGSGKSTIAKIICGIYEPFKVKNMNSGVYINGEKMTYENYSRLQHQIGMVFQNPDNQFIGSTVQDDIAFGLENDQVKREDMEVLIKEYSKKVGMDQFLTREPSSLSGGQKQRVAIAGTLVRKPKILILDEATSMLDPKGKREINALIKSMKKENKELTIISITHDIEEAYQADEVIVLNKGKIIKRGLPEEVFSDLKSLEEIELDIPFVLKLKNELKKYDINVNEAKDLEELVRSLCR